MNAIDYKIAPMISSKISPSSKKNCDNFKALKSLFQPDPRIFLFGEKFGDISHFHKAISRVRLKKNVPEEIRIQFDVSRNILIYSFFSYRMSMGAQMYAYAVLEKAFIRKIDEENVSMPPKRGLGKFFRIAIEKKWINDHAFRHRAWRWSKRPNKPKNLACRNFQDYLTGRKPSPGMRNSLMHEPACLESPWDSLERLHDVASLINQLFRKKLR